MGAAVASYLGWKVSEYLNDEINAHVHHNPDGTKTDIHFWENRITGEKEDKIFQKYKFLMDVEFPNPMISTKANILDEKWLLCPLCIDAWESVNNDGMVICPNCHNTMHNPRYQVNCSKIML